MLELRCPALARSYEELLKRIKHTGTVMVVGLDGKWYHSSDPTEVKKVVDRINKVLNDEDYEEQHEFEMLLT
jgi:hypothetical protein